MITSAHIKKTTKSYRDNNLDGLRDKTAYDTTEQAYYDLTDAAQIMTDDALEYETPYYGGVLGDNSGGDDVSGFDRPEIVKPID